MRGFLVAACLASSLLGVGKAMPHRVRAYPNPALTIFSMVEGPDGFLWLAAADGLYRFDGFHYHKITSFPFASARFVAFTRDGSLWCGGLEGLSRVVNNRFQILLNEEVYSLAAYPDQLFLRTPQELIRIGLDGSVFPLPHQTLRDLLIDFAGKLWFVCRNPQTACSIDPDRPDALQSIKLPGGYQTAVRDPQERIWAADLEHAVLLQNGRPALKLERQRSHESRRPGPLLVGRNGQLWFLGETVHGLTSKLDFGDRAENNRYPPISGVEDSRGRLWVAALGRGLAQWTPEPQWQRWSPEDFGNQPAVQVVRDHQGSAILATQGNLYRLSTTAGKWSRLMGEGHRYAAILPLEGGGFLASIREFGLARLSAEGRVVERLTDLLSDVDGYREIARDGKGRLWVGHKRGLFRLEGRPGSLHLRREDLPEIRQGEFPHPVDLEVDAEGRLWAGYAAGLAWLDDQDRWHKLATDQPVTTVRSFALGVDDIWVAHRRAGTFSRLRRKGAQWSVTLFSANAGFGPVDTHFLKRDSRGWIWRGSPDGVHISDGLHVAPEDWIHVHLENGLATDQTDQYGFFEDIDGSVWIAGGDGVSHLQPEASWFAAPGTAPAPQITRVEADGRVFLFPEPSPLTLPSTTKMLRVDVGSLQAAPFRDYPLRYRLLPLSEDWQLSSGGTLEFRNLRNNAYTLQIGYTGTGASAIAAYPLTIGSGGTGLSWLWLIGLLMGTGALVPALRHALWFDRAKFRIEKALFLLRWRYAHRNHRGLPGGVPSVPDYSGETFSGRYQLCRIVSRGGFSVVYEARDLREENTRLAVKILNRNSNEEGWVRDRFAHEVAALRSVEHPGVVRILDSWVSPSGELCLAMPFLDGQTVRAALNQIPFRFPRIGRIVNQLGAALSEVHSRGIIHRDLKPENLILLWPETDREQAVIIDFGTAGMRSGEGQLAATTLMAGSFHYMAPERLTGRYSPASDVFSLGVIILEMLTGKRLAELNATFSDRSFQDELEEALRVALGNKAAKLAADRLSPAYDPEPRRRPADVKAWAADVVAAFDHR